MLRATRYTDVPIVPKLLAVVIRGEEPDPKLVRRAGRILVHSRTSSILDQHGKQGLAVFRSSVNVEIAVAAFLEGQIRFTEIQLIVEAAVNYTDPIELLSIEDVLTVDQHTRAWALQRVSERL